MSNTLYIGIDPGKNTGVAFWDAAERELDILPAWDFWKAWSHVAGRIREAWEAGRDVVAVVEDPTQNAPVWSGGQTGARHVKIAQNVGANKRDAQLWISGLEKSGLEVRKVKPTKSKWSKSTFQNVTGYTGRTSEHGRDAGRLVYDLP